MTPSSSRAVRSKEAQAWRSSWKRVGGAARAEVTARHDALSAGTENDRVEAAERPLLEQQLADLAALKVTSELRQSLTLGSPEWRQALHDEDGLIARVLAWAGRHSGHLHTE
jgi:hypothetical protein